MTDADEVFRALLESNPWWDSGRVPQELTQRFRRRDFYVLKRETQTKPVTALAGPRQVGKTTLLYQLIEDLLSSRVPPKHIVFVSFDFPGLSSYTNDPINDVLSLYADRVLGTAWRDAPGRTYAFLDEVTRVSSWHRDIKGWFDLKYPVKFFISSSSLSSLRGGTAESLAGRVSSHLLLTWKFVDVLSFLDPRFDWNDVGLRLREAFQEAVEQRDLGVLERGLKGQQRRLVVGRPRLRHGLDKYLRTNGFPELLSIENAAQSAKRLREYLDITIASDLYRHYQIRSTGIFEDLLGLIARESGQLVSYRNLAQSLQSQERTIVDYLEHLSDIFLISQAQFYAESRAKRLRRQRKAYVPNPGIRSILLGRTSSAALSDSTYTGPLAEGVVHDHAKRLSYCLTPGPNPEAFYWRNKRGQEVDIVIVIDGVPVPVEVKYRAKPDRDLQGIESFLEETPKAPFGLVVTRDMVDRRGRLMFLPLSHFLLMA